MAPPGNPLHVLYEAARTLGPGGEAVVQAPAGAVLYLDGKRATARATDRPVVLQVLAESGQVLSTAWLKARDPLPFSVAAAPPPVPPPAPEPKKRISIPLLAGGGVAALVSGGLYGIASSWHAAYDDPANPDVETAADLSALRTRTNAAASGSVGAGVLAAGLLATAVVQVTW